MLDNLNEREQEILHLLDDGLSDQEISHRLALKLNTIKWYNRQIYDKLGVTSRTQAVARAHELCLLAQGTPPQSSLPVQTTALIGRQREIAEVRRLLKSARLLTLTGSPGTGKTRLALQVAAEIAPQFVDGVYFVPLAALEDASQIPNAIANVLNVENLQQHLQTKQLLLILDNFEHLLSGVSILSELLADAPYLKILVTSRAILNLYGETEYFVPPLILPVFNDNDTVSACESVTLFVQRAQAVKPNFELTEDNILDVAKICLRLEGLPLAIELAAARIKLLPPQVLLQRLNNPLETLVGGARDLPTRQQTMRNAIDWSYSLLNVPEKRLFARLAVFACGWTLEAAEQVCSADLSVLDGLTVLVDHGLVQWRETHFTMLEMIRAYALECLEQSGEAEAMWAAYEDYFTGFAPQSPR